MKISREAKRIGIALAITAVIFVAGFFFVTRSLVFCCEVIGMSDVEIIKHHTLYRVVPPEWVAPGPEGLVWSWMKVEVTVRCALVLATWLIALILIDPYKSTKREGEPR